MRCDLCHRKMLKNPSDLSFYIYGNKINIRNYPFYVCPRCAQLKIKQKDMRKTVFFLRKQTDSMTSINELGI
ncbi:MAG: hypothetical protein CVV50_01485 [Spirochaetae bacterium HGW-Spirochaetae-6]|nr:MAG: hypothetical protein CVV50_01485 [Spirochaetae bacterium HGW-Spirochaetae-6]